MTAPSGILVLDKPAGITSRDAVDVACQQLSTREIGHCGTLDPLATGVLVLVVGRARRLQELLSRSRKVYEARVRLGSVSATDDAEGPVTPTEPAPEEPSIEQVREALPQFVGEIEQRPPAYSAVKVSGKRLYDLARKGETVDAPLRTVQVFEATLREYDYPHVDLRVACAGGTYVRSIARDLGEVLGTGGYLESLTRVESGGFRLAQACPPDQVTPDHLLSLEQALAEFPRIDIAATQARRLGNGAAVHARIPSVPLDQEDCLFGWVHGRVVALLRRHAPGQVRSQRLLVTLEELERVAEEELAAGDSAAAAGGDSRVITRE